MTVGGGVPSASRPRRRQVAMTVGWGAVWPSASGRAGGRLRIADPAGRMSRGGGEWRWEMSEALAPRARAGRSAGRRPNSRGGPAKGVGAGAIGRVRWDRLGRLVMLVVLVVLLYLYLSAGVHMFSTWGQSRHDRATVASMEREHRTLLRQHEALGRQSTVEGEARRLGMKKAGERQYIVSGLPAN
jgi:hypothetical protein